MQLFESAGNPIPQAPVVAPVLTSDGLKLRTARWSVEEPRGTVAIAIGRSEFIEEYFEVVRSLLARRFVVVIHDWRGQGQSDREIAHTRRGFVSSFAAYRRDLKAVEAYVLKPLAPRPWYALGHSMGAAILVDQAHDGASPFERLVLTAPMIDIPLRHRDAVRRFVRVADRLGFATSLIPGGSELSIFLRSFESNILTSDPRQYRRLATAIRSLPELSVGAPTIHWLAGAFDLMQRFRDPRYAPSTLTPILMIAAGADHIVDTAAAERFAIGLKAGRCVTIPYARHQIIMENDAVSQQVWAAFDAFVPPFELRKTQNQASSKMPQPTRVGLF